MIEKSIESIIESYFEVNDTTESKRRSFDKFLSEGWPTMVKEHFPIVAKFTHDYHILTLEGLSMNKPIVTETDGTIRPLLPKEARLRQETYEAQQFFNIRYRVYQMSDEERVTTEVAMTEGKLIHDSFTPYVKSVKYPIPLHSFLCHLSESKMDYGECNSDKGCYFIIDGQEKMLMYRERLSYDKLFLFPIKNTLESHLAEFRSSYFDKFESTRTLKLGLSRVTKTECAHLQITLSKGHQPIPWVTFIRALGVTKARDIYTIFRFIARSRWSKKYKKMFKDSLKNNQGIVTRQAALALIGAAVIPATKLAETTPLTKVATLEDYGIKFLRNRFLPNMGTKEENDINKIFALCIFACSQFDFSQNSSLKTNKDSLFNKDVESCEDLLGPKSRELLVSYFNNVSNSLLRKLKENKSVDVHEIFSDDRVGKGLKELLATGVWHVTKGKTTQTGVSGKFDRANYIAAQSQHTKVISQLRKEVKQITPRLLPSTAYGTTCPADSPEGETCGLVKFNSILQHQSIGTDGGTITDLLIKKLCAIDIRKLTIEDMRKAIEIKSNFVIVHVNGRPIAVHDDASKVAEFVRGERRSQSISSDTGVSFDTLNVYVRTNRGRNMRPLFVVKNMGGLAPPLPPTSEERGNDKGKDDGGKGKSGNDKSINNKKGKCGERIPLSADLKWQTLLSKGIVEYVDKEEEQNLLIAPDLDSLISLHGGTLAPPLPPL
jgi:DNA-directed RNA polymerase II subunit RPB2